jgi:hypothetical protein
MGWILPVCDTHTQLMQFAREVAIEVHFEKGQEILRFDHWTGVYGHQQGERRDKYLYINSGFL